MIDRLALPAVWRLALVIGLVALAGAIAASRGLAAGPAAPAVPGAHPLPHRDELTSKPTLVDLRALPPASGVPATAPREVELYPVPAAVVARQRAAALLQPPGPGIQRLGTAPGPGAPSLGPVGFEAVDSNEASCGGCLPPDGDVAVGPGHVIGMANTAFEIYNRGGATLSGPTGFAAFFQPGGCTSGFAAPAYSDPFGGYDPAADRFMVGILAFDQNNRASRICIGVSQTPDPTTTWYLYTFPVTNPSTGNLLDYPQVAIWHDAIYLSGNRFDSASNYLGARVVAYDKSAMYAGLAAQQVYHDVANDAAGNPADTLHAAWPHNGLPASGPAYFIAQDWCSAATCDTVSLWRWTDPFGADTFALAGGVRVTPYGQVINPAPQPGGTIAANDWRNQDAQYSLAGGVATVYGVHAISCNPGLGAVNCIQWYQLGNLDGPGAPTLVQQGIAGADRQYRMYPDLTVDAAGNLLLAYAYVSPSEPAGIRYTGRLAIDPPGQLQNEAVLKAGETGGVNGQRWGDYAGMVIDPVDGCTAWHLEEYARSGKTWSTWIGTAFFSGCKGLAVSKVDSDGGATLQPGAALAYTITVQNTGAGVQTGIAISDTLPACMTVQAASCTGYGGAANCTLLPPVPGTKTTIVSGGALNPGAGWRIRYDVDTTACPAPSTQTNTAFAASAQVAEASVSTGTRFAFPPVPCFGPDAAADFANFSHTATTAATDDWQIAASGGNPGTAFYASDPNFTSDKSLIFGSAIPVAAANTYLLFDQRYGFEYLDFFGYVFYWDGAVLDASTDGGLTWVAVDDADFVAGGYGGAIMAGYGNPLGGRNGWVGQQAAYGTVIVDLSAQFPGRDVLVRWRLGSDTDGPDAGWWIDNVRVQDCGTDRDVLSGFVYADCNLNGTRDVALVEKGLSGVQLQVSGDATGSATTNAQGFWQFVAAPNTGANYTVQVNPATLPEVTNPGPIGAPLRWNTANGNTCPPAFANSGTYWIWGENGGLLVFSGLARLGQPDGFSTSSRIGLLGNGSGPTAVARAGTRVRAPASPPAAVLVLLLGLGMGLVLARQRAAGWKRRRS